MGMIGKNDTSAPLFYINGHAFTGPSPEGHNAYLNPGIGYQEKTEQLVRSTRNANGQVVSEVINRRLEKFENLYWPYLSAASVTWLRQQIKTFNCELSYWDDEDGIVRTRQFYWGDFEATPCEWETITVGGRSYKKPTWYKEVKCNLIDKGY